MQIRFNNLPNVYKNLKTIEIHMELNTRDTTHLDNIIQDFGPYQLQTQIEISYASLIEEETNYIAILPSKITLYDTTILDPDGDHIPFTDPQLNDINEVILKNIYLSPL